MDETFRIRVYDQRPGDLLPGTVLYEAELTSVPRVWTGRFVLTFGAPREFRYEIDLPEPLAVAAHTTQWLEIAQIGDVDSFFLWEFSQNTTLNGRAFINPIVGDWTPSGLGTSNGAYQLVSIPEPNTFVLLSIAGILLTRRPNPHWS